MCRIVLAVKYSPLALIDTFFSVKVICIVFLEYCLNEYVSTCSFHYGFVPQYENIYNHMLVTWRPCVLVLWQYGPLKLDHMQCGHVCCTAKS